MDIECHSVNTKTMGTIWEWWL